ncbi:C2 domain protein [Teladorsagia circumcincta]|uniref:C2 domain protein n=1 Tax=Teladorsagia circumcincta TaxID=45464 RepID=A0A2G9TY77_TELCI|nr:C2 domain protein [Teladorsagia circumcincta]
MALRILHKMLETEIVRHLRKLQSPDYYTEIYVSLKAICSILEIPSEFSQVAALVHMYSFTTNELILSYYAQISEDVGSSNCESASCISIQVGYIPSTGDNVLIIINVLGLENVPEVNTLCDRMDPYVRLELLPSCIYPPHCFPVQKTRTLTQCEDLKWNQDFQFLVPQQLFYTHGSSLCISVLDHDRICDELIGRAFLSTNLLPRLDCLSIKKLPPPQSLRLGQPSIGHRLPFYKMLKERSQHDDTAKAFIRREKTAKEMYFKCLSRRFSTRLKNFKKHSI